MLLAGDVGGTKTLLGLFEAHEVRPRPLAVRTYSTNDFRSFAGIVDAFARDVGRPLAPTAAAVGVAGPVVERRATLTNVHWAVSADEIGDCLGTRHVALLNDLEAIATSLDVLAQDEIAMLQEGVPRPDGNAVVIAAGTGLGQAYLHRVNGRLRPAPSEGGHADFAARTDREMELVRELRSRYGRAEVEQVASGQGLRNLHRFTHRGSDCPVVERIDADEAPARMTQGAMAGRCQFCADALGMFVEAYGAEAGNLALRGLATSGVYIGGGIAPKILRALQDGRFMQAFLSKAPMTDLLLQMPVGVILSPEAALIGAAVRARDLAGGPA